MLLGEENNVKRNVITLSIYCPIKYYFQSSGRLWKVKGSYVWLKTTTKQSRVYAFKSWSRGRKGHLCWFVRQITSFSIVNNLPKGPLPRTSTHTLKKVSPALPTPHPTRHNSERAEGWCARVTGNRADGLGVAEDLWKRPSMAMHNSRPRWPSCLTPNSRRAPFEKKPLPLTVFPRVALEVRFWRAKADAGKRAVEGGRRDQTGETGCVRSHRLSELSKVLKSTPTLDVR